MENLKLKGKRKVRIITILKLWELIWVNVRRLSGDVEMRA